MQVPYRALMRGAFIAGLVATVVPRLAWTQCEISGPDVLCTSGSSIELCAPAGSIYEWWGEGAVGDQQCMTVSWPGTYYVTWFDPNSGLWFGPCAKEVTWGYGEPASITGPSTGCANQPVELCGPEGPFGYAWTGPTGFAATTRCVSVSSSGVYSLVLTGANGCPGAPAYQTMAMDPCPSDDPPPVLGNCPRPPSWWLRQCNHDRNRCVDAGRMADLAAMVDRASPALDFSRESFCRTLAARYTLRARARRHVAAVHANICAGEMGLEMLRGPAVRLSRSAQISLAGVSTTVGEWIDGAEQQLIALEPRSQFDREVRRQYAEIVRVGWLIDHGRGLGVVCTDGIVKPLPEDASPAIEMADAVAMLDLEVSASAGSADVDFAVSSETTENVTISVYDVAGRRLAELANGPYAPGTYRVHWSGPTVGSGVYFVRGRIGDQASTQARVAIIR
jgi:hypothetical protein